MDGIFHFFIYFAYSFRQYLVGFCFANVPSTLLFRSANSPSISVLGSQSNGGSPSISVLGSQI